MNNVLVRAGRSRLGRSLTKPVITRGVVYSGSLVLDAYAPPVASSWTIIRLHGGGWTSSSACGPTGGVLYTDVYSRNIANHLVARGFCVLNLEYTLVPVCTGSTDTALRQTMLDDIRDAVVWARANADQYNGSLSRIVLMGESAGGHLALMATIQGTAGQDRPDGVIAWSPLTRLDQYGDSTLIKNYLGISSDPSGAGAATAQQFSPYNAWVAGIATKARIGWFGTEAALRQADGTDMRDAILAASGTVTYNEISGSGHSDFSGTTELDAAAAWIRAFVL